MRRASRSWPRPSASPCAAAARQVVRSAWSAVGRASASSWRAAARSNDGTAARGGLPSQSSAATGSSAPSRASAAMASRRPRSKRLSPPSRQVIEAEPSSRITVAAGPAVTAAAAPARSARGRASARATAASTRVRARKSSSRRSLSRRSVWRRARSTLLVRARRQTERRLKLRKLLLFLARTLVLAAVALALARPRAERPEAAAAVAAGPAATVILLDGSGSMGWRLGGETPLRARPARGARGPHPAGAPRSRWRRCSATASPPRAVAPSFDRAAARQLLADARPTALHADLTACLAAAAQGLAEGRGQERLGKRIVVVTDLTATAWRLDAPPPQVPGPAGPPVRPEVEVVDVAHGAPLPNLAVTGLTAEPDAAVGPRGYRVTATVLNAGTERAGEVSLTLRAAGDSRPPVRAFLDLPPGGSVRKTFSHAFTAGGPAVLTAALPADPLALDDERSLTLRVPREVRALVVDGAPSPMKLRDEAWFVEAALGSAASPVRPTLIDAEALATADLRAFDVVLLLNVRTVGTRGADLEAFVQAGGGLFLSMGDQVDPDAVNRELAGLLPLPLHLVKTAAAPGAGPGAARLARIDEAHPALAVFTGEAREGLVGARFQRYMLTRPAGRGEPPVVLAAYDDGAPALVEARRGQGRVLLYTSTVDRDWTDWPLRTSFLPAMQRFAGWLSGALDDRRDPPTVVGTPRTLHLGPGRRLAALVEPDGAAGRRATSGRPGDHGRRRERRHLHAAPAGGLAGAGGGARDHPRRRFAGLRRGGRSARVGHPAARPGGPHRLAGRPGHRARGRAGRRRRRRGRRAALVDPAGGGGGALPGRGGAAGVSVAA